MPGFHKQHRLNEENTKFIKSKSVFAEWKEDSYEVIERCLAHDFDHWKIGRFIKDTKDQDNVKNFIRENFHQLKELRAGAIADSGNPPQLTQQEFHKICKLANI